MFCLALYLMMSKQTLTAINNAVIINKKESKIYKFYSLKFVGTVFVSSIISSHVATESSIILAKYLPFLHLLITGF